MSFSSMAFTFWAFLDRPTTARRCLMNRYRVSARAASSSPASESSSEDIGGQSRMKDADRQFWSRALHHATRPSARSLVERVDLSDCLGITPALLQASKKPPLLEYFRSRKIEHPNKVILVRIGEFYEAVGIDAIMLVQHAGLNPMGRGIPRAGCPAVNLRRTLRDLVLEAGFSVVVCEEVPEMYSYGTRTKGKERYIAQIVTPSCPNYLVGLVDHEDVDVDFERETVIAGVAASVGGFNFIEIDVSMMMYKVHSGQTIESILARLQSGLVSTPLYVHDTLYEVGHGNSGQKTLGKVESILRATTYFQNQAGGGVANYSSEDAVKGLLDIVAQNLKLTAPLTYVQELAVNPGNVTKPLYLSTATQLGIHKTRGMPDLVEHALGAAAPSLSRQWIRKQLLMPPPSEVRAHVQRAVEFLLKCDQALPNFPTISKHQVSQLIRTKEASEVFFRELHDTCQAVYRAGSDEKLCTLIESLVPSSSLEVGLELNTAELLETCLRAVEHIEDTIIVEGGQEAYEAEQPLERDDRFLQSLWRCNEGFVGKVRQEKIESSWQRVVKARQSVVSASEELVTFAEEFRASSTTAAKKDQIGVSYDLFNNAVWLRLPSGAKVSKPFMHPKDRNGTVVSNRYSTEALEQALDEYRAACFEATLAVREQLRNLSEQLGGEVLPRLIGACILSTIASALTHHVSHAGIVGQWQIPSMAEPKVQKSAENLASAVSIRGFWPYWLDRNSTSTVLNSLNLDSLVILTGPNMAGKSTVLRSVCAVVLLATAGLLVPAKNGSIPFVDNIILRTFSSDSPAEKRSGFAVEMHEMRSVLEDVTAETLVLVDELGKGTETTAGAALAGSILEVLDASKCRGIFATHLHALFDLNLNAPNMKEMQMCTSSEGGRRRPTLKIAPGRSTESMAMTVARDCGLPDEVVSRAEELFTRLRAKRSESTDRPKINRNDDDLDKKRIPTSPVSPSAPHRTLLEAEEVLRSVMIRALQCESTSIECMVIEDCERVRPPPAASLRSCVYIVEREDGWLYCGETDDIRSRLKSHMRAFRRLGHGHMRCLFIPIPMSLGGKSAARFCETQAIAELSSQGFRLLSDNDKRHRSFAGTNQQRPDADS